MPHAIPQTHSSFYPHRDARAGHVMKGFLLYGSRLVLACENIRFSSLFASLFFPRETSPAAKSEEKRMFSQATLVLTWYIN